MNCDDAVGSSDGSCIISNVVHVILQVACFRQSLEYHLVVYYLVTYCALCCACSVFSDATLQFTDSTYSNLESAEVIRPAVQLLTNIATDLTVRIVPVNITEALTRPLPSAFPTIPPFNPRTPNIATSELKCRLLSSQNHDCLLPFFHRCIGFFHCANFDHLCNWRYNC